MKCFGYNGNGELGLNNKNNQFKIQSIDTFPNINSIHCGYYHSFILNGKILNHKLKLIFNLKIKKKMMEKYMEVDIMKMDNFVWEIIQVIILFLQKQIFLIFLKFQLDLNILYLLMVNYLNNIIDIFLKYFYVYLICLLFYLKN